MASSTWIKGHFPAGPSLDHSTYLTAQPPAPGVSGTHSLGDNS